MNIFYYPIDTWADFIFFNFCMDRGAGHQLEDVRQCSYGPWARAIEGIFKEEKFHIRHGEFWVRKLAEDPGDAGRGAGHPRQVVRPHHEHLRPARLRPRTPCTGSTASSCATTTRSARPSPTRCEDKAQAVGLTVPEWKPVWDRLPEEAQIPG